MTEQQNYQDEYSEEAFWKKIKNFAAKAGHDLIERSLQLYYAAQRPETPAWAKTTIYGALGYFISPIDAISDLTPGIGFADDLGVLALAISTIAIYVNDEVKQKANDKLDNWFGE